MLCILYNTTVSHAVSWRVAVENSTRRKKNAEEDFFFSRSERIAPAIYFTRVDAIIIGACRTIELISAAKALDREVYRLTQMERAKETRFLHSHALLSDYLCVYRGARSKEEWEKVWRKIGRERERERERRNREVNVHSRATCTLNDKRRPLSTVQCEKWPHVTDETIRRAPTTGRYDNIAKSFRECVLHSRTHSRTAGCYLRRLLRGRVR